MNILSPARWRQAWQSLQGSIRLRHARPEAEPETPHPLARPYPWETSYPDGLDWDTDIAPRPLTSILDDAVAHYPQHVCLRFHGKRYRYKDVDALVARTARGLQDLGVGKGTPVGLVLPNSPYYVIAYFAVLRAGGVVVNLNPLYAARELDALIRDAGVELAITLDFKTVYDKVAACLDSGPLRRIVVCRMRGALPFAGKALLTLARRKQLAAIPNDGRHLRFDDLARNRGDYVPAEVAPEGDVAVLQFTGGTTGIPKAARLTHANLYVNAVQTRLWGFGTRPGEEKVVGVLPLFHAFGMTGVMNVAVMMGAELILLPRFKVKEVLKLIHRRRPTIFMGVPTMFSAMTAFDRLSQYDLSSLRYCLSGGAPLPLETQRAFEAATGCSLVEGYGLTEAGPVCTVNPEGTGNRPGSVGLPLPRTIIEIADLEDPDRLLGLNQCGEVCVRGPQVMPGYHNQPGENAETLRGGRLHTGDVGYLDDDGYLHIVDRIKDLILVGGFNVYPRMVEEAIYLHTAVAEAAVVGIPDRHHGEVVKAYVSLREGHTLTAKELREFLRDKLATFELPRRVEIRETLPKTLIGKVSRGALRAELKEKPPTYGQDRQTEVGRG